MFCLGPGCRKWNQQTPGPTRVTNLELTLGPWESGHHVDIWGGLDGGGGETDSESINQECDFNLENVNERLLGLCESERQWDYILRLGSLMTTLLATLKATSNNENVLEIYLKKIKRVHLNWRCRITHKDVSIVHVAQDSFLSAAPGWAGGWSSEMQTHDLATCWPTLSFAGGWLCVTQICPPTSKAEVNKKKQKENWCTHASLFINFTSLRIHGSKL